MTVDKYQPKIIKQQQQLILGQGIPRAKPNMMYEANISQLNKLTSFRIHLQQAAKKKPQATRVYPWIAGGTGCFRFDFNKGDPSKLDSLQKVQ